MLAQQSLSPARPRSDGSRGEPRLGRFARACLGTALVCLAVGAPRAMAVTYIVSGDGTGNFSSIQACANVAKAGDTCVVQAGTYDERVQTTSGGAGETQRVIFRAQGLVTMPGFDISHPYVTVENFQITGHAVRFSGHFRIYASGDSCRIVNNTIHDGAADVYGILFYNTGGQSASNCIVSGNRLTRLGGTFLATSGDNHLFEHNVFEHQNSRDYIRLFGSNHVFRRNVFWRGSVTEGTGGHPDFLQTFGTDSNRSEHHLFEENWIEGLTSQFAQAISGDGVVRKGILHDNVRDITFRRNVIANISNNANFSMPGVTFVNNTFYRLAYKLSGVGFSGTLTRGKASGAVLKSNVFLAGGSRPTAVDGIAGFYGMTGATFSREVLSVFVTQEKDASGNPTNNGPITSAILDDLVARGYINGNGRILDAARALSSAAQFVVSDAFAAYKPALYENLMMTVQLDEEIRSTFRADYNFVAGAEEAGFPGKRWQGCTQDGAYVEMNFCEEHGINGGDPRLLDLANLLGQDGVPFTLDDGLKPLPGSPLCGKGEGGTDIGAYSCDPAKVFPDTNYPRSPTNLRIVP